MQKATERAPWHILRDDLFTCCVSHELKLIKSILMQTSYRAVVISGLLDHRSCWGFFNPIGSLPVKHRYCSLTSLVFLPGAPVSAAMVFGKFYSLTC